MKRLILGLALATATSAADASSLTLYDTGLDTSGQPYTSTGNQDTHYSVVASPTGNDQAAPRTTFISSYFHAGANPIGTASASWITAVPNGAVGSDQALGVFDFQQVFNVAVAGTYSFSGSWGTDNCGSILINGSAAGGTGTTILGGATASCSVTNSGGFSALHTFSFAATLSAGTNKLDFDVYNSGLTNALIVDNLAASPSSVPLPPSLPLLAGSLMGIGMLSRRAVSRSCNR